MNWCDDGDNDVGNVGNKVAEMVMVKWWLPHGMGKVEIVIILALCGWGSISL